MKKFLTVLLVVITLGVFGQSGTSVKPGVWLITDGTTAKTSTFVDSVVINGDLTVTGITTWVVDMLYNALTGDSITTNFVIGDTITVNKLLWPDANDGAPIGTATVSFSDLFLASGGVINWNNSDVTLTHGSNTLTFAGGNLTDGTGNWTPYARLYGFDTIASTSMITDGTWKTLAGVQTGLVSLTDGTASWTADQDLTGFDTITATGLLKSQGLTFPDPGTSASSGIITLTADNSTTNQTATIQNIYGADPYLKISAPVPSGTARPILELHDEDITLFDGSTDVDYTLTFNGKSHDGSITYMEDEDRFDFDNAVKAVSFTDGTATLTLGSLTGANLINADTVTANYFSGEADPVWISDSTDYLHRNDTTSKVASRYWVTDQAYLTVESDPVWISDSTDYLHRNDTTTKVASRYWLTSNLSSLESDPIWLSDSTDYLHRNDTTTKVASRKWVTDQAYLTVESDPVFAGDSAAIVHWADTTTTIATQFDISALGGGGWTVLPGTPDTIYENNLAVVKLNNWLMTDYITDGTKLDEIDGLPLNVGNTILGNSAFVKNTRLGDSSSLSTYLGYKAGYDADTVSYSTFLGYGVGIGSHNVEYSTFIGNTDYEDSPAGKNAYNISSSIFIGGSAGENSHDVSNSSMFGLLSGYGSAHVTKSYFFGHSAGQISDSTVYSVFLGRGAGYGSIHATNSSFIGENAGNDSDSAVFSIFLGYISGQSSDHATSSTFLGTGAGYGSHYVSNSDFLGYGAGQDSDSITGSTFIGYDAGLNSTHTTNSIFIGYDAGEQSDSATYSLFMGSYAGAESNNLNEMILIGDSVGYGADGISHQVWIDDSPTATPLIQGFFDVDSLVINGDLTATGNIQITGDGSPTFRFQVIADTLCSVRVGIDTVRLHPPR